MLRPLLAAILLAAPASLPAAEPPPAAVFDHLALYVKDHVASAAFYKGLFGFTEIKAPFANARWLVMGGGVTLHIVSGRTVPQPNDRWDHFAVACADMDKMIATLDARRIDWVDMQGKHAPQTRPDGVRQIFIRDPDGYWIEINDAKRTR